MTTTQTLSRDAQTVARLLYAADANGISEVSLGNALDWSCQRVADAVTELANLSTAVQTASLRWVMR